MPTVRNITMPYTPQPKQLQAHLTTARQIFYGGAAMGGKSVWLRWDQIGMCLNNPGLQAYLFRRTRPELEDNHIKWIRREIPQEVAVYNESRKCLEFKNGSAQYYCYCETEQDVYRYLGAEMHHLGLDEASRMIEGHIMLLRTRNRLGSWKPAPGYEKYLPRVGMASNPGGPSHNLLKEIFVGRPPEIVFHDETTKDPYDPNDNGWTSIYIPARMRDNKYVDLNYAGSFTGLPPELAQAYRDGDWDAVVGRAFHNLSRDKHQLRSFKPPAHWTKFMSIDWGSARPFSVGWYCVCDDSATLTARGEWAERFIPAGAVIRYAEWYGWNGKANQGCRMDSPAVARAILEEEKKRGETMDRRIADSSMWNQHDGPSIAERMMEAAENFVLTTVSKDRKHAYAEILARLAGNPLLMTDGKTEEHPMFFVTDTCRHFWRTVPTLTLDETDPEKGYDTKLEDHCADEVAYALTSRPYITTETDRWHERNAEFVQQMRGVDPYSTHR